MAHWVITGASSGLGRALAETLIANGHAVTGTVRTAKDKAAFESLKVGKSHAALLDVTAASDVRSVIDEIETSTGAIDVLVNNAGYGLEGAVEEVSLEQIRNQFEVNVFGAVSVIQAVLPHMRKRKAGHIINITSMGGLVAFPGVGIYNGSKYALEGISEALAKEVKPLGIRVTIIEPGSFRTDWAGRSMIHVDQTIADYGPTAGAFRQSLAQRNGKQAGDPRKAAKAIMAAVASDSPPLHLLLGADALRLVGEKLGALQTEILKWAPISTSTDFDDFEPPQL